MSGIVLTSLMTATVTNKLAPQPFDVFVINWMSEYECLDKKRHYAAKIIQVMWHERLRLRAAAKANPHHLRIASEDRHESHDKDDVAVAVTGPIGETTYAHLAARPL